VTLAQHQSASNEHYTPIEIVDAARLAMGGAIDCDPATTALVNQRIKATTFYTQADDGLSKEWHGRVFLNPPGGKTGNKSNAAVWWAKLVDQYLNGDTSSAIFVGFTLEILATSQDSPVWLGAFPICIPRHRLAFDHEDETGALVTGNSPAHSNVICYLPDPGNQRADVFVETFSKFGQVIVPQNWST
jgi:hypothetical protein